MEQVGGGHRAHRAAELVRLHLRRLRESRQWSARELAERCDASGLQKISRNTIAKIENGHRDFVTVDEVQTLAHVLRVAPGDFFSPTSTTLPEAATRFDQRSPRNFVCPYCYSYFSARSEVYRCGSNALDHGRCIQPHDERHARYWGDHRRGMGVTFSTLDLVQPTLLGRLRGTTLPVECPHCRSARVARICPECHADLPVSIDEQLNLVLGLVGPVASGKSCFVGALIDQLQGSAGERLAISVTAADDATSTIARDYVETLRSGMTLPLTATSPYSSGRVLLDVLPTRTNTDNRGIVEQFYLSLSDLAGEEFSSLKDMERNARYVGNSNCLLLFLDPQSMHRPIADLPAHSSPHQYGDLSSLVANLARAVRLERRLPRTAKIPIPLGIALSMWDIVEAAGMGRGVSSRAPTNVPDRIAVDRLLRSVVCDDWGYDAFVRALDAEFSTWRLFPIAALGRDFNKAPSRPGYEPAGVVECLLWALRLEGVIGRP